AFERAISALQLQNHELFQHYQGAMGNLNKLDQELTEARRQAAAENEEKKRQAELKATLTKNLQRFAFLLGIAGVVLIALPEPARQARIGGILMGTSVVLIVLTHLLSQFPDWAYQVLAGGL